MQAIPRAELPDQPKNPAYWLKVIRAAVDVRLSFYCLADELLQVWVHWDPIIRRNFPCFGPETCPRCGPHSYRIWQAYISGGKPGSRERFVVEITKGCAQKMKAEGLLEKSLYGQELTITRKPKDGSKNGAVLLLSHTTVPLSRVPKRVETMPSVLRLWTWNEEHYEKLKLKMEAMADAGRQEIRNLAPLGGY